MRSIIESALDLIFAFIDFLRTSSVSVSALQLIGIILVTLLLGLLFGRMTKRGVPAGVTDARKVETGHVSLDFERLTPLGPSEEAAARERAVMDIAALRADRLQQETGKGDSKEHNEPILLKE